MNHKLTKIFSTNISKNQSQDTGMALVLVFLLISIFSKKDIYVQLAIIALLINMIVPRFYQLIAILWLGLSQLLGTLVSKILLSIVFFIIVTPVGLIRKLLGIDNLQLKKFKKSKESVMIDRNVNFKIHDIEKPY